MSDVEDEIAAGEITDITFAPIADPRSEQFVNASKRLRPEFSAELAWADDEFDQRDVMRFFSELSEGYGANMIGLSLGWSPAKTKRFMLDPARAEIIEAITEALNESVEHAILRHARDGNSTAMKLWAYNRMQHRGWADKREIRTTVQAQGEIVMSVRQALNDHTRERVAIEGSGAIAELQGYLDDDVIEVEAVDR